MATATAIALCVDAARLPVYLVTQGAGIVAIWPLLALATIGVVVGTALGTRLLASVPEAAFHRIVGVSLIVLGVVVAVGGD